MVQFLKRNKRNEKERKLWVSNYIVRDVLEEYEQ